MKRKVASKTMCKSLESVCHWKECDIIGTREYVHPAYFLRIQLYVLATFNIRDQLILISSFGGTFKL